jgi:hypothetical protein
VVETLIFLLCPQIILDSNFLGRVVSLMLAQRVAMKGIGAFLISDEIYEFTNSIIKTVLYKKDRELKNTALEFIVNEYLAMNENCQNKVKDSLASWVNFLKNKENVELAEVVEEIRSSIEFEFEDEIPF